MPGWLFNNHLNICLIKRTGKLNRTHLLMGKTTVNKDERQKARMKGKKQLLDVPILFLILLQEPLPSHKQKKTVGRITRSWQM